MNTTYTSIDGYDTFKIEDDNGVLIEQKIRSDATAEDLMAAVMGTAMDNFGDGGDIVFEAPEPESYDPELLELTGIGPATAKDLEAEGVYDNDDLRAAFENGDESVNVISSRWHDTIRSELGL